ncbi:hypothetical protein [Mycobacterium sp. GA-2829]|uniref:hypothetical protein n=1 Tax=Mycobacterium sp. GA-2829 TaxID=1772283 RepID=UPI00073FE9C6|nr:hypothetical protein [Mycobacterium sp. GA-2829]KUI23031.1 hypothetical protein AU194_28175 [Mycobacterium sp. GA-2829]
MNGGEEREFRNAAMAWLDGLKKNGQKRFPYRELAGFECNGVRIPLIDRQRGIRKPASFYAALSLRTTYTPPGQAKPYEDQITDDGLLHYKYRGNDPKHHENRSLRAAYDLELPLIWFVGVAKGVYEARYPVWIRDDRPEELEFVLELPG